MPSNERGSQLVREIIEAVEKDKELRYMLLGALGFQELLERFQRLEERQQRLEEKFAELEEKFAKLEERQQKLEERFAELEERFARLEERFARLEERFAELEARQQRLEERFAKLEERVTRLEEEARETRRVLAVIAHRFGVLSEEAFREAMKYVVEEVFGVAMVDRWVYHDREGQVYGYPSIVEVDVVVRDSEHILLEVKSRVSRADVAELYKIGLLYERVEGKKPRLVILGGFVDEGARTLAKRMGVEIVPIATL